MHLVFVLFLIFVNAKTVSTSSGHYAVLNSCEAKKGNIISGLSCNFENGMCNYSSTNNQMTWIRNKETYRGGFLYLTSYGDHSSNKGFYLEPNTNSKHIKSNAIAEISSPEINTPSLCLQFWYLSRDDKANINILLECQSGKRTSLVTETGITQSNTWISMGISIQFQESYKIIFQTVKRTTGPTIWLDDIQIYNTPLDRRTPGANSLACTPEFSSSMTSKSHASSIPTASSTVLATGDMSIDCTFENGPCGWLQGGDDDFDWQIGNVSAVHGMSVPRHDHTKGGGNFAFIDGKEARFSNWTARLTSGLVASDTDLEFTFWYFMNGIGIGSLTLYKQQDGKQEQIWRQTGRQGREWNKATVELGFGQFKLVFVARTKYHYGSDLAIDDTLLSNASSTTTTIRTTHTTTIAPVRLPVTCDFEHDVHCTQIVPSVYKTVSWKVMSGPLSYKGEVFIKGDNSSGNGHYLSLTLLNKNALSGDFSGILLPVVESDTPSCLKFAYTLPSKNSGTLSVYKKTIGLQEMELKVQKSSNHGKSWQELSVDFRNSSAFQVLIEGDYSGEPASFIGIDDISFKPGPCPVPTTSSTATTQTTTTRTTTSARTSAPVTTAPLPTATTKSPTATTQSPTATTKTPTATTQSTTATTQSPTSTTPSPTATTQSPTTTTPSPTATTLSPTSTTLSPTATTPSTTATTQSPISTTPSPISTTLSPTSTTLSTTAKSSKKLPDQSVTNHVPSNTSMFLSSIITRPRTTERPRASSTSYVTHSNAHATGTTKETVDNNSNRVTKGAGSSEYSHGGSDQEETNKDVIIGVCVSVFGAGVIVVSIYILKKKKKIFKGKEVAATKPEDIPMGDHVQEQTAVYRKRTDL